MDNNERYSEFDKQFNDLPLPGEEQSWEKMKQMLDEDEKNRKPVVPIFLKTCAGWGLALLLVGAITWFVVKPQEWWKSKEVENSTTNSSTPVENAQQDPNKTGGVKPVQTPVDQADQVPGNEPVNQSTNIAPPASNATATNNSSVSKQGNSTTGIKQTGKATTGVVSVKTKTTSNKSLVQNKKSNSKPVKESQKNNQLFTPTTGVVVSAEPGKSGQDKISIEPTKTISDPAKDGSITTNKDVKQDSLVNKSATPTTDSAGLKQPVIATDSSAVVKKEKAKKSPWIVSAGVGLQQQIPIGGQKAVPYDYYGRSGSLSDYIPSVYVRLEKENKWFVQGEFRYGAPQTLEDFQYSRQTKIDSQNVTVTTFRLKKTYYHQLPFSFNYYVLPNLSVGVGGIYNRFYGAVTEKEVKQKDLQTQVETMSREIVNIQHFNDSFLYKTQVHALLQVEYHWKRFDFGLRYTKDVQPYIKYTQPDGKIDVKKNQTFQLLARYRIWQSRKK